MIFLRAQSKGKEIIPDPSQSLASHQSLHERAIRANSSGAVIVYQEKMKAES